MNQRVLTTTEGFVAFWATLGHVASACTCLLCRKWKGDIREHAFISSRLVLFSYALFVRKKLEFMHLKFRGIADGTRYNCLRCANFSGLVNLSIQCESLAPSSAVLFTLTRCQEPG